MLDVIHVRKDDFDELVEQHRRLRSHLLDLVTYTRSLEQRECPDCAVSLHVTGAEDALATLEWRPRP